MFISKALASYPTRGMLHDVERTELGLGAAMKDF